MTFHYNRKQWKRKKKLSYKLADYFNEYITEKNLDYIEDFDKDSSNNMNTSTNISAKRGKKKMLNYYYIQFIILKVAKQKI